jgi:hypothetical protein
MHGKRNHHGTTYSYCQPRNRPLPEGHTATVWLREDRVLEALTTFFNTYVLGPDRADLVATSLPAATAAGYALRPTTKQPGTVCCDRGKYSTLRSCHRLMCHRAAGRVMVIVVPAPGRLSAMMCPLWSVMIWWAMAGLVSAAGAAGACRVGPPEPVEDVRSL